MGDRTDEKRLTTSVEDWTGCDLENASRFEVMRAYNGVVVRPCTDYSRDTVSYENRLLVFQDPAHFFDWLQQWMSKTRDQRT